jgi:hypothetical protein
LRARTAIRSNSSAIEQRKGESVLEDRGLAGFICLIHHVSASPQPFERALSASANVIVRAARGTVAAIDEIQRPFGIGKTTSLS